MTMPTRLSAAPICSNRSARFGKALQSSALVISRISHRPSNEQPRVSIRNAQR
ncbi:hypothetical protein D3C75_1210640 [compost metagenome]